MSYRIINMDEYKRKAHFEYFKTLPYPYIGVTVDVDVTGIIEYAKQEGYSFYLLFMHAVALAADGVVELRQRIKDNQIIEYEECPTSHVELLADNTYCYCTLHHHMDLKDYFVEAKEARFLCKNTKLKEDDNVESMYFISTLPWLKYSALIQPVACGDESNPRITWGKYEKNQNGCVVMPVSILAHHALVDGINIAQFYDNLNKEILKYKV